MAAEYADRLMALAIDRILGESPKAFRVLAHQKHGWVPKSILHIDDVRWLQEERFKVPKKPLLVDVPRWFRLKWG